MDKLPVEILIKIIDFLDPREQVQLQLASKRFLALARDNGLWRLHCYEESWQGINNHLSQSKTTTGLVANATAPLSSLGQSSLRSLIQLRLREDPSTTGNNVRASSFGKRTRAAAEWDPSVEGEDVDWYSEYIARQGPISFSWLQQPFVRGAQSSGKTYLEIKGMGLLKDWSSASEDKVVAPLDNGTVCIWNLNHFHHHDSPSLKGKVLAASQPGILSADLSPRKDCGLRTPLDFPNVGECVSIDSIRRHAYIAAGNILNEIDLETLKPVTQQRFPFSIFALSQETDYLAPLTLATTLSLQIYDWRLATFAEHDATSTRCETPLQPDSRVLPSSLLQPKAPNSLSSYRVRSPDTSEREANYAPLFQPGPLSILHPPAPHVNSILLAGRFPSILCYDRRYFPQLQNTVHSGARLCGLAAVPSPRFPAFSGSPWPTSHAVVACGEYNGRGSLELYKLDSLSRNNDSDLTDTASNLSPLYHNRQSAARSKILSVASHGTRIVYSDADGNIKWIERDGRSEVRLWNLNSRPVSIHRHQMHQESEAGMSTVPEVDPEDESRDIEQYTAGMGATSPYAADNHNAVARKILPTEGRLTADELLIWTGERIGRIRFSNTSEQDAEDSDSEYDELLSDEVTDSVAHKRLRRLRQEERQLEREYAARMHRALERQADEVRWMGRLGMA